MTTSLPPCGLYRTVKQIGEIPAGRLVYFHNHGNPGAGVYFPEKWHQNRATFSPKGSTLPPTWDYAALAPLPREGFYRAKAAFHCCPKKCVQFEPDAFLQLGYNGAGKPIVFVPELTGNGIQVPDRGTPIDDAQLGNLVPLNLPERKDAGVEISMPRGIVVH